MNIKLIYYLRQLEYRRKNAQKVSEWNHCYYVRNRERLKAKREAKKTLSPANE